MKKTTSDFYDRIKSISYTPDKKIKLISSKLIKEKHGYRVVGEIENNESYMWDSVELVAIFKDKNDELLYLASAYVRDLNPGEKRYFQTLQPCSDDPHDLGKFKDYELRIETASANFKTK
ncbi:MAG: FxLYD domain-containing protein [Bdellovibrionota bacterium]